MLEYLATRSIPGVEKVEGNAYYRSIALGEETAEIKVEFLKVSNTALLTIFCAQTRDLYQIVERVRVMFDLKAVSTEIEAYLSKDPLLQTLIEKHPGIRVPVAWDGFEVAVRAILGQQVSVKGATTLVSRLAQRCGSAYSNKHCSDLQVIFPTPKQILASSLDGLGITTRRIASIKAMAECVEAQELRFDGSMSSDEFVERSTQIPGIGPWTAQYIALRALNDPDAFPHADLILLRAAAVEEAPLNPKQLLEISQRWRPWRAYVVMLLWRDYALRMKK